MRNFETGKEGAGGRVIFGETTDEDVCIGHIDRVFGCIN